jgi:hypothetical protein
VFYPSDPFWLQLRSQIALPTCHPYGASLR